MARLPRSLLLALLTLAPFVACTPPEPRVYIHKADAARVDSAGTPGSTDLLQALRNWDLRTAQALAQSPTAQRYVAMLRNFRTGNDEKALQTALRLSNGEDSLLGGWAQQLAIAASFDQLNLQAAEAALQARWQTDPDTSALRLIAAMAGTPEIHFPGPSVRLPLRVNSYGNALLDVQVNGKTYTFWIDTGAAVSVIASDVADACGVRTDPEHAPVVIGSATSHVLTGEAVTIDRLLLGPVRMKDVPALMLDKRDLSFRFLGIRLVKIDGILGWPLLRMLDMEIDFPGEMLTLRPAVRRAPTEARNLFWYWHPVLQVRTLSGAPLNLEVDTGSATTFFYKSAYAPLGIQPTDRSKMLRAGAGGNEMTAYDEIEDARFRLGPWAVRMASSEGFPKSDTTQKPLIVHGTIGQDIFRRGILRLDPTNHLLEFRMPASE